MKNKFKDFLRVLELWAFNVYTFFKKVRHSIMYDLLTYRDLVDEILDSRPLDNYESVSILKEEKSNKIKLLIVYLDEKNEPVKNPYGNTQGFYLFAKDLDDEIKEIFGEKNIFIFK